MIARGNAVHLNTTSKKRFIGIYILVSMLMSVLIIILIPILAIFFDDKKITDEKEAQLFLKQANKILAEKTSVVVFTKWNFNTDINDQNENKVVSLSNQNLKLYIILFYHSISCCQ
jgi:hypothetical protein